MDQPKPYAQLARLTSQELEAAELAAEALERPKHLEQWDRSLVAVVIVAARKHPGLASRAAHIVRGILEDEHGELVEMEPTPSGHWSKVA